MIRNDFTTLDETLLDQVAGGSRSVALEGPRGNLSYQSSAGVGEGRTVSWTVFGASGGHSRPPLGG
jgi:hypothetical protein